MTLSYEWHTLENIVFGDFTFASLSLQLLWDCPHLLPALQRKSSRGGFEPEWLMMSDQFKRRPGKYYYIYILLHERFIGWQFEICSSAEINFCGSYVNIWTKNFPWRERISSFQMLYILTQSEKKEMKTLTPVLTLTLLWDLNSKAAASHPAKPSEDDVDWNHTIIWLWNACN